MRPVLLATAVLAALAVVGTAPHAQEATKSDVPKFAVDPTWPKDLPKGWITGQLGGVCVDGRDNVYVVNRRNITDEEKQTSISAPSIIKFNATGDVAAAWGDDTTVPGSIHGCVVDSANNIYVGGNGDGIIQKYDETGKLVLQIGTRGKFDTVDGTAKGAALEQRPEPAQHAVRHCDRSGQWRHLCLGRLRQPPRRGVRQNRSFSASMGAAGD